MEQEQLTAEKEAAYVVPWEPSDHWVGILLLVLMDAGLFLAASQDAGVQLMQSASLVLIQLAYLLPLVVVFVYRRIHPKTLGLGRFDWSTLGVGCGLLPIVYLIILTHNVILLLLGVDTQGTRILELFSALESPLWFMVVGAIFAPIVEELFFRGFLFQGFRQQYGWVKGALLSSLIFGAAHLDPVAFFPTTVLGFLLAYLYHRANSVWAPILLHMLINAFGLCAAYAAAHLPGLFPV